MTDAYTDSMRRRKMKAGWYPDPQAPYSDRWWTGSEWQGEPRRREKIERVHQSEPARLVGGFFLWLFVIGFVLAVIGAFIAL